VFRRILALTLALLFPNVNSGQFRAIAQAVSRQILTAAAWVRSQGFVVDKVALGQVFFREYFGFPCQVSFHRLLHIHHHLPSGAGTIGQWMADVPSGRSLTPLHGEKRNYWGSADLLRYWRWRILFHVKPAEPVLLRNRTSCFCTFRVCWQRERERVRTDRCLCFVAYFTVLVSS
jgi:hypothetical protein